MSNEFAKREGRPQLKHLLLPRTTGFNASLESLRASSPVVYDVTMVRNTNVLPVCLLST
jgi:precorrin isomerase